MADNNYFEILKIVSNRFNGDLSKVSKWFATKQPDCKLTPRQMLNKNQGEELLRHVKRSF